MVNIRIGQGFASDEAWTTMAPAFSDETRAVMSDADDLDAAASATTGSKPDVA